MNKLRKILAGTLALLVLFGGYLYFQKEEEFTCGGLAGWQCPNGYYCTDIPSIDVDGTGVCKKIDLDKLASCMQNRDVALVCSTKFNCGKEREILGNLFQFLKIKYDDNYTDCKKYGDLCENTYHDFEMIGWIIPKTNQYPLIEANKYPQPTFRGTRTTEGVMWMSGCKDEVTKK